MECNHISFQAACSLCICFLVEKAHNHKIINNSICFPERMKFFLLKIRKKKDGKCIAFDTVQNYLFGTHQYNPFELNCEVLIIWWHYICLANIEFLSHLSETRIVGFLQSLNETKDENPTRKTCNEYFKSYRWQKWKS